MSKSWFKIRAVAGQTPEILIYDYIGAYGVDPASFDEALKELKGAKKVALRINSPGGEVFAGIAIMTMLDRYKARHKATIDVYIDGVASSMASAVAMVGDQVIMPSNAMMMIHDPRGGIMGTAREMRDWAEVLDKLKEGMVSAYARKSGKTREDIAAIMEAETWYTAAEAADEGFADVVEEPVNIAAYFDLTKFKHPPAAFRDEGNRGADASAPTTESEMTDTTTTTTAPAASAATAAPAASAAPAPTAAAAETADQMRARLDAEAKDRNAGIVLACDIAGHPEMAGTYIAEGKSLNEVMAALKTLGTTQGTTAPAARTTGSQTDATADDAPKAVAIDTGKIYDRFNGRPTA